MKEDQKIYAQTVSNKKAKRTPSPDQTSPAHENALRRYDERREFKSLADKAAESSIWFLNWRWPGCYDHYPNHPEMRVVDKYYPYAKGGPILVDEPMDETAMMKAYEKQKVLKRLGYRHIVIEQDSKLYDVLMQIGAL